MLLTEMGVGVNPLMLFNVQMVGGHRGPPPLGPF